MPLAHRPSAYEELRSKFCFLGKFDIISPDEIERLAEKVVTLYQDDTEQRFSNELLSLLTIRMSSSIMRNTPLIYNDTGKSFSKLKYIDLIADFARSKGRNMPGL